MKRINRRYIVRPNNYEAQREQYEMHLFIHSEGGDIKGQKADTAWYLVHPSLACHHQGPKTFEKTMGQNISTDHTRIQKI